MADIPSTKSHPVIVSIFTTVFFIGTLCAGGFGGWIIRAAMESKAELSVVVDDGKFMQTLEGRVQGWIEEYNIFDEEFHNEVDVPECIAMPMPDVYHDADFIVRSNRQSEE